MRASDILEHFLSRADWIDRETTVDRVIAGDPDLEADRCRICWMPRAAVLQQAAADGVRLILAHEPTFWNHHDDRPTDDADTQAKLALIEELGLTIVRLHDSWDRWPEIGIPFAWARHLGFDTPPAATGNRGYQHRYDIDPIAFDELAGRIAARCASLGEPSVQASGDGTRTVSRIGVNTGCASDIGVFKEMGCDCSIVADDGSCYWAGIERAAENGHPVIRVNHGTCEEPGMATLTQYINEHLESLQAEHVPQGSIFRLVG